MGEHTKIEWADHTWNPWWGCTKVSVGEKGACEHCYAERMAARFNVGWGPHAARRRAGPRHLHLPHRWQARALRDDTRPFVFCASMADIFDNQVPPQWRAEAFATMRQCDRLVFLLLTKRPGMVIPLAREAGGLPPNAAVGASIVTQAEMERDGPILARVRDALHPLFVFGSFEPLMGAVDAKLWLRHPMDWVIAGGESGPHARPSHPDWFRSLRDQCAATGVPFLFKQWGEWMPIGRCPPLHQARLPTGVHEVAMGSWTMRRVGKHEAGRMLDDCEHNGFPEGFGR